MERDVTGRKAVHLDVEMDDLDSLKQTIGEQIVNAGTPLRMDVFQRDGKFQLCIRELGTPEPDVIS